MTHLINPTNLPGNQIHKHQDKNLDQSQKTQEEQAEIQGIIQEKEK